MNTSGEAADQVVRMSLEVGEAALKISGTGAKHWLHFPSFPTRYIGKIIFFFRVL